MAEPGGEGFSLEMALLGHSLLQSEPGQWTKCKPNRKLVLLRVLKRWARVSEGPPPATSPPGHTATEVQTTAQNHAATGMWAQKEAAVGKASGRGLAIKMAHVCYSRFDCESNTMTVI